jgi:hypothetical protein
MASAYTSPGLPASLFLRLGREQQWIAFALAGVRRTGCFGSRHISCVDDDTRCAYERLSSLQRLALGHAKFRLPDPDDDLARRKIIIDQDDFI